MSAQYTTCALASSGTAIPDDGTCLINQVPSGTGTTISPGGCGAGNSPDAFYFPFVAGSCDQFDIAFDDLEDAQMVLWEATCTYGAFICPNEDANTTFTESFLASDGSTINPLVDGTTYILEIATKNASNFDICYTADTEEAADNECSGATGVGASPTSFYNGGDCEYTGSLNDATTTDEAAITLCAGTLENTQWSTFSPDVSNGNPMEIQIIGSGINCAGPVCGWQFGLFSGECGALIPEGCISEGDLCVQGNPDLADIWWDGVNRGDAGGQPPPDYWGAAGLNNNNTYTVFWDVISETGFTGYIEYGDGSSFDGTEEFYFVMDGNANSDCQYTLSGVDIVPNLLPIELIHFSAERIDNNVLVEWTTSTEINNDYFSIERSRDGLEYEVIGILSGAGNSATQIKYTFLDQKPIDGISYYRLKQTDYNGAIEVFDPTSLYFSGTDYDVNFYSLSEEGQYMLNVRAYQKGNSEIAVFDLLGKLFFQSSFKINKGQNSFDLDFSKLNQGLYSLRILNGTQQDFITFVK